MDSPLYSLLNSLIMMNDGLKTRWAHQLICNHDWENHSAGDCRIIGDQQTSTLLSPAGFKELQTQRWRCVFFLSQTKNHHHGDTIGIWCSWFEECHWDDLEISDRELHELRWWKSDLMEANVDFAGLKPQKYDLIRIHWKRRSKLKRNRNGDLPNKAVGYRINNWVVIHLR